MPHKQILEIGARNMSSKVIMIQVDVTSMQSCTCYSDNCRNKAALALARSTPMQIVR